MPEDAAWFWSQFLSFRLGKEDRASASAGHGAVDAASPPSPTEGRCSPGRGPECQLAGLRRHHLVLSVCRRALLSLGNCSFQ